MNAIYKIFLVLALSVLPTLAFASQAMPSSSGDTIPAFPRYDGYYYTKWFDDCPNYRPDGVVDSCFCFLYQYHNFYGFGDARFAKWERANGRLKIKGLVAMLMHYNPPTVDTAEIVRKRPEYLKLYQMTGTHEAFPGMDAVDLTLVDSVRWDTATARVMELRRGWAGEFTQYCYLYEAYFKQPVYVDTDFYIYGTNNSNYLGSGNDGMIHTVYVDIMDFGFDVLNEKYECDRNDYNDVLSQELCRFEGGYVALVDMLNPEWGWVCPYPDSPVGYYLAIVDRWTLDAHPNQEGWGEVLGSGRWPDESIDTIEAIPAEGYSFLSWNDGNTENPRAIQLTSDTSFVAIFTSGEWFNLQVSSSNETQGTVAGSGMFPSGSYDTITALPHYGYKFVQWNDGVTDNPRVVYLESDTSFVAYFTERPYYNVLTAVNNSDWGSVEGGGTYMEGDEATLTVTTEPFCIFEGWDDDVWQQPRTITVTQDTLFTALFSYDSTWTAGVDKAPALEFRVAPNPTTGRLTIQTDLDENFETLVYDMNGKVVMRRESSDSVLEVDLSRLPTGQYFLMVRTREQYGIRTIVKK